MAEESSKSKTNYEEQELKFHESGRDVAVQHSI